MGNEGTPGRPTTRRYAPEEKARAVRLVWQLRKELGTTHGTIRRVADQIGCGVESLRTWVKQADIDDGVEPGLTSVEADFGFLRGGTRPPIEQILATSLRLLKGLPVGSPRVLVASGPAAHPPMTVPNPEIGLHRSPVR